MDPESGERRLAAILSADVVAYSRLMAEDEAATVRTLSDYREEIGLLVQQHSGHVVDTAGDSLLAEFPTATGAVECAVEVQRVLGVRNVALPSERRMEFRIGVHLGEVRAEGDRIYGDGVNIAARLEALAEPGGICVSGTVRDQVESKLDLGFEDLGEQSLKNIPKPVHAYRVQVEAGAPRRPMARSGRRTALIAAAVAAVLVLAGVVTWLTDRYEPTAKTSLEDPLLALPTGPRVAVLPFTNLSGDPEQEYFSDALTDGIITALSRFKDLFVIARNSTFRYKGQAVDVRQLREDLGARYVVEGSVQKARDTLRVTAQLLDAKDGTHLWADTYDRHLSTSNIFAVQDEITEQVVATIAGLYGVISRARFAEVKEKPTESLAAYECVLRTIAYYRDRLSATEHEKLRRCLERAVKSDPGYANAWAALSFIYFDEHRYNYNPRASSLDRALNAARRAVDTGPTMQWPHSALASVHFYRHDLDAFYAEAERAIELNPNNSARLAHLGGLMVFAGDERGIALVRKAAKLDPFHPTWFDFLFSFYHFERSEYEAALVAARKVDMPDFFWTPIYLAVIYAELGRQHDAQSALDESLKLYPGLTIEKYIEEARKHNHSDDTIRRWLAALRKAGLKE